MSPQRFPEKSPPQALRLCSAVILGALLLLACSRGPRPVPPALTPVQERATVAPAATPPPPAIEGLGDVTPPQRDLLDLARRFRGLAPGAEANLPSRAPVVGETERFLVVNQSQSRIYPVSAVLRLITPHALFYAEDGLDVSPADLERAGREFEEQVYPRVTAAFGLPQPGPDRDGRISILHLRSSDVGGYFTASDQYAPAVSPRSNARNVIYINSRTARPGTALYNAVVAHELQHLIHWHQDHNEAAWVNEGLSELAAEWAAGSWGRVSAFLANPDLQLNAWPPDGNTSAHYAAGYLFFRYLFQRLQSQAAGLLLNEQADGIAGVRAYLRRVNAGFNFEDLFADWVVTNFVDEPDGGRYGHWGLEARTETVSVVAPGDTREGSVRQFGTDYLEIKVSSDPVVFRFEGAQTVRLVPTDAYQGQGFWWSNRGDGIDTTLTREFDLGGTTTATLRFWTWFDLERGWDYGYVAVSTDGGRSWQALSGRQTTDYNPFQLAYGPGYTGRSGGPTPAWVEEEIDLTPFAGRRVLIRFEHVTDDAANGPGWAIDAIQIPEIGFYDDAESDAPGWTARGFQRVSAPLPQRFIVQLIAFRDHLQVQRLPLDETNRGEIRITGFGGDLKRAVIAISGATDGTTEPATYRYSVSR